MQTIKQQNDIHITTLTKGVPLYQLLRKNPNALEYTDRVIFSIDTLNNEEHTKLHLPLMKEGIALGYLEL